LSERLFYFKIQGRDGMLPSLKLGTPAQRPSLLI
jgi:hypothetical protein